MIVRAQESAQEPSCSWRPCSLPRSHPGHRQEYVRTHGPWIAVSGSSWWWEAVGEIPPFPVVRSDGPAIHRAECCLAIFPLPWLVTVGTGGGNCRGQTNVPSTWPEIRLQSDRIHAVVRRSPPGPQSHSREENDSSSKGDVLSIDGGVQIHVLDGFASERFLHCNRPSLMVARAFCNLQVSWRKPLKTKATLLN